MKIKLFWILAIMQALLALVIFCIELMAITSVAPWENYPFEHRLSLVGVLFFCFGAIISCRLMWLFDIKNKSISFLPSPAAVLLLAAFVTVLSAVFFHYLSMIGWCCEHPLAFFFGFPFSYLVGIGSSLFSEMLPYKDYNLLKILSTSQPPVGWQFLWDQFLLDFLFWSNTILVLLSFVIRLRQKTSLFKPIKEEIQSEVI